MTTLFIASKNPPFKRNGFDKPFFFNTYWKRKGNLTDEQVIDKAMQVFDKQFFNGLPVEGEISAAIDFQTFKIRLDQSGDVFRSSFFKIKFEKEKFNRYCWVVDTKYLGQNTIEFTLETDLWITFMPQINFDNKRSVECKRRMPERYVNFAADVKLIDPTSIENNFLDPLTSSNYFPTNIDNAFSDPAYINDKWAKYFQFHTDNKTNEGVYLYALVKGTAKDVVNSGQYRQSKSIALPYFIYPIIPDDTDTATMAQENPDLNDVVSTLGTKNTYYNIATSGNPNIAGIFELPIPLLRAQVDKNFYQIASGNDVVLEGVRLDVSALNLNSNNKFYDALNRDISIENNEFTFFVGNLLMKVREENEPIIVHHQTRVIQIVNAYGNAPLIPYELFLDIKKETQSIDFTIFPIINGATNKIVWKPKLKKYEGFLTNMGELFWSQYNYSYALNSDLPVFSGAWDAYITNHRATYYTGAVSGVVNNLLGGTLGLLQKPSPMSALSIGTSAVAGSISSIANTIAQQHDLKHQANAVNTSPTEYLQSVAFSDGKNGLNSIIGQIITMEVLPSIKTQLIKHYRLFGNPIQDRVPMSFEGLQRREFWNYWELDDVQNTFIFDNIPPFVIDELDKMFSNGIRLWPVWWDNSDNYIDTIYDYDLENWETSLELDFAAPIKENNGIL